MGSPNLDDDDDDDDDDEGFIENSDSMAETKHSEQMGSLILDKGIGQLLKRKRW